MSYTLRFTKEAEETISHVLAWVRIEWGEKSARRLEKRIFGRARQILRNPFQYPESKLFNGTRKCVVTKQNTLFYKVRGNEILVITLWDNRRDPTNLPDQLSGQ